MKKYFLAFFLLFTVALSAQVQDYELGKSFSDMKQRANGGYYDYSNPNNLNMAVSIWGYVKFPGRYLVPSYTSMNDLISLAGGPTEEAELDDLRLYRIKQDSTQVLIKINMNDILWGDEIDKNEELKIPKLIANDIVVIPGSPRLFFKDWFSIGISIFSTLLTLSILITK